MTGLSLFYGQFKPTSGPCHTVVTLWVWVHVPGMAIYMKMLYIYICSIPNVSRIHGVSLYHQFMASLSGFIGLMSMKTSENGSKSCAPMVCMPKTAAIHPRATVGFFRFL